MRKVRITDDSDLYWKEVPDRAVRCPMSFNSSVIDWLGCSIYCAAFRYYGGLTENDPHVAGCALMPFNEKIGTIIKEKESA